MTDNRRPGHDPTLSGIGCTERGLIRLIMLLGAAAACVVGFMVYSVGRAEEFGWSWGLAIRFVLVSPLILATPITFAVAGQSSVAEFCERTRRRRFEARSCVACGYPLPTPTPPASDACPECGAARAASSRITDRKAAYAATAAAAVIGACVGAGAVELLMRIDESRFRAEVEVRAVSAGSGAGGYSRARAWPFDHASLVWNIRTGFHGTD